MEHKLYQQGRISVWDLEKGESFGDTNAQRARDEILRQIYNICNYLQLDTRDLKYSLAQLADEEPKNAYYRGENSFSRITNNGLPKSLISNLNKFDEFLNSIIKALKNCVDGTYMLQYSDIDDIRKACDLWQKKLQEENKQSLLKNNLVRNFSDDAEEAHTPSEDLSLKPCRELPLEVEDKIKGILYFFAVQAHRADPKLDAKEEKARLDFLKIKSAKSFFDAMEDGVHEIIEEGDCRFYKIPTVPFNLFLEMLKDDKVIMRRLMEKFEQEDYYPFA